jgi:hypothetical protein
MFLAAQIRAVFHHNYHAFHHVLTIKKPRSTTAIFQNTPQKPQQKTTKAPNLSGAKFFLKKT